MYIVSTPLCFLIYAPGYFGAKIYDKYQIEPSRKWPWKLPNWDYMKKRTFWNLILNNFVVFPLYIYLGLSLFGSKLIYEGFPTTYELIKSFFIIMVLDDTIFMIAHGLFHKIPFLYRFHKVHHEYVSVFSGIGQYAHPLELILGMSVTIG
jgi:sterol desaturase/sphingolipid hydroxylase (fatty acid hydroxylase superfamily)